jgi:hypothetical protein
LAFAGIRGAAAECVAWLQMGISSALDPFNGVLN